MMKQLPTESKKFDLKNWCIENKAYLLLIILIYQVAVLSIGIINFPYLDDNARHWNDRFWYDLRTLGQ